MSILRGRWIAALTTVMAAFVAVPRAQTPAADQRSRRNRGDGAQAR